MSNVRKIFFAYFNALETYGVHYSAVPVGTLIIMVSNATFNHILKLYDFTILRVNLPKLILIKISGISKFKNFKHDNINGVTPLFSVSFAILRNT